MFLLFKALLHALTYLIMKPFETNNQTIELFWPLQDNENELLKGVLIFNLYIPPS